MKQVMLVELTEAVRSGDLDTASALMGEISYQFRHVPGIRAEILAAWQAGT